MGRVLPIKTPLTQEVAALADGSRTFPLIEGEPLPTSHGVDLYRRVYE